MARAPGGRVRKQLARELRVTPALAITLGIVVGQLRTALICLGSFPRSCAGCHPTAAKMLGALLTVTARPRLAAAHSTFGLFDTTRAGGAHRSGAKPLSRRAGARFGTLSAEAIKRLILPERSSTLCSTSLVTRDRDLGA